MKKTITLLVILCTSVVVLAQSVAPDVPYYPRSLLRKISDSMAENCGICASDLQKEANKALAVAYPEGAVLDSAKLGPFVRNANAGQNELLFSFASRNEFHRVHEEKGNLYLPLPVLRVYPAGRTVAGIAPQSYTEPSLAAKVSETGRYNARLQIIGFEYGEARTFMFLPRENKLVIHCRLLSAERI